MGGGAGRPRGGSGVPPQLGLGGAPAWGGGTPSPTRFQPPPPLSENCRLTFKLLKQRRILKCVSLRFVNYADMIETLLRTITDRGIWKFIWLPHISTITLRSNEPLTYDTNFPLSHDSLLIRGYDRRYLCIPSSTSLPISTLFSFP